MIYPTRSAAVLALIEQLPEGCPAWFADAIFDRHAAAWDQGLNGCSIPDRFSVRAAAIAIGVEALQRSKPGEPVWPPPSPYPPIP